MIKYTIQQIWRLNLLFCNNSSKQFFFPPIYWIENIMTMNILNSKFNEMAKIVYQVSRAHYKGEGYSIFKSMVDSIMRKIWRSCQFVAFSRRKVSSPTTRCKIILKWNKRCFWKVRVSSFKIGPYLLFHDFSFIKL